MRVEVVLLTALAAAACASPTRTIEGRIDAVGTDVEPRTSIAPEGDAAPVYLTGDLELELRRAAGATARVTGEPVSGAPGDALRVRTYRLLEIDGERPWVGIVRAGDDGPELELEGDRSDALVLVGLPPGSVATGSKAWVVGPRTGAELRVRSYGVLRPAGAD